MTIKPVTDCADCVVCRTRASADFDPSRCHYDVSDTESVIKQCPHPVAADAPAGLQLCDGHLAKVTADAIAYFGGGVADLEQLANGGTS